MKNTVWLFFVLFVLLLGCSPDAMQEEIITIDENTMTVNPESSFQAKATARSHNPHLQGNAVERSVKWRDVSGTIRFIPNSDACEPGRTRVLIEGYGQGSHFGRFHVTNTYCLDEYGNPVLPITGIVTAANGDQIFVVMTGSWQEGGLTYWSYLITGGNGRFTGASGSFTNYGFADYVNLVWELQGEGVIVY